MMALSNAVDMKCGPGVAGASSTGTLSGHVTSSLLLPPACTGQYLNAPVSRSSNSNHAGDALPRESRRRVAAHL